MTMTYQAKGRGRSQPERSSPHGREIWQGTFGKSMNAWGLWMSQGEKQPPRV